MCEDYLTYYLPLFIAFRLWVFYDTLFVPTFLFKDLSYNVLDFTSKHFQRRTFQYQKEQND